MASVVKGINQYKGVTQGGGIREGRGTEEGQGRGQLRQIEARARGSRSIEGREWTRVGELEVSRELTGEGRQTGRCLMSA